jgi:hypothetical protein
LSIYLNVDLSSILNLTKELEPQVRKAFEEAGRDLSMQAHAHLLENVQQKLHSTREKYVEALSFKQVSNDTWIISLDKSAIWIEEGMPEHEMIDDLLKSPKAKTAKDGSKYMVIPFQHNKGQTSQTQAGTDLTNTIKSEMQKRKIPYGKLETDSEGKPKTGLLHSFDILKNPPKTSEGPGQGRGPLGVVRQGPTGIPFLQGVRVYQKEVKGAGGKSSVKKSIMTFRIVSSKHKGTGRWVHPGIPAKNFFDEAADWALKEWEQHIAPKILEKVGNSL